MSYYNSSNKIITFSLSCFIGGGISIQTENKMQITLFYIVSVVVTFIKTNGFPWSCVRNLYNVKGLVQDRLDVMSVDKNLIFISTIM